MQKQASGPRADPQALLPPSPSYGFGCPWTWPALMDCSCVTMGPTAVGSLVGSLLVSSGKGLFAAQPWASWLPTRPAPWGSHWTDEVASFDL